MRHAKRFLPILVVLLLVACASTPTKRWAQARVSLTAAQDTMLVMHDAQVVSDDQLVEADQFVQAARAGLEKAEESLPDGGTGFEHWMGVVMSMLDRVAELYLAEAGL